jgi:hypothetical protein
MDNSPERQAIIDDMMVIAREDAPWLWGFHPKQFSLYHAWYKNSKPNLMANNALKYKRIDASLRARLQSEWNKPVLWPFGLMLLALAAIILPAFIGYRNRQRQSACQGDG